LARRDAVDLVTVNGTALILKLNPQTARADGGRRKKTVQRHDQTMVRVIVSPTPYSVAAREEYAERWRTATV